MTVTADSFDAKVSAAICDMLAACAAWSGSIVEDWGGMEAPFKDRNGADAVTTAAWSIVKLGQVRSEQVAADTIVRSGDATIYISLPFVAGDTTAETIRRARNLAGTVADQMRAQLGGTGKLAFATFDPQTPILAAEVGAADGNTETAIDVAWRETP